MVSSDSILVADYELTKSGSLDIRVTGNLFQYDTFDSTPSIMLPMLIKPSP